MKNFKFKYCNNLYSYSRFITNEVFVGEIPLGKNNPIRLQSMTNTDTLDTNGSVEQCIKIFDAGADYVRLTVQTNKHAENLKNIKDELIKKGYDKPLIADVHFNANIAETSAKIVEKVRINPGNYSDKKTSENETYNEQQFESEIVKIEEKFSKLIEICKKNKTVLRIGSNHGSLSNRIISKYGDTPEGMVESVFEFLRIAKKNNFDDIVISLKSSNTRVMVFAYRLLKNRMLLEKMNFPIHLGVTEAGDSDDGRIKSAVGIGTLLIDGIGDTIRVSLTEEPEAEIPVAKQIVEYIATKKEEQVSEFDFKLTNNPFEYSKRNSIIVDNIGGNNFPVVIADLSDKEIINDKDIIELSFELKPIENQWIRKDNSPDYIYIGNSDINLSYNKGLKIIKNYLNHNLKSEFVLFDSIDIYMESKIKGEKINFIEIDNSGNYCEKIVNFKKEKNIVFILKNDNINFVAKQRKFIQFIDNKQINAPVISKKVYFDNFNETLIKSSIDFGPLLIDGLIDGAIISNNKILNGKLVDIVFGIFQASRSRVFKTEYISCPSCGRTLFDIQEVTTKIKKLTNHLKGLKIGIMGCIVNGPGEMSDADYGYVGTGIDKVSLYKGQQIVKKSIPSKNAVDELIKLIKENGDWIES